MDVKDQRKVDPFIIYAMAAAKQAIDEAGRRTQDQGRGRTHRRPDRLGHRRASAASTKPRSSCTRRAAADQPVLHSGPPDQSRLRLRLDPLRPQGPEPFGRDRLLDRRACHRRSLAADRHGRRRRDGGGRHRKLRQPHRARGLCRLPRALDQLQRQPDRRPRAPTTRTATAS